MIRSRQIISSSKINFFSCLFIFCLFLPSAASAQKKDVLPVSQYHRIVSLKPNITLILQSLGLSDEIVGITKYCAIPNSKAQVIADYNSIDVEAVIRLKPDLIITSSENTQSRQFESLRAAGLNIHLFEFRSYEQMKASLLSMANLVGLAEFGREIAMGMDEKLKLLLDAKTAQTPLQKSFVLIVQRRPLMVASGHTYLSSLFEKIGMRNAFANNQIAYSVIDEEQLIRELVDYTFDITNHEEKTEDSFLNKTVTPIQVEDFLAAPQSVDNLIKLFQ